jgi:hypothetical protein
MPIAWVLSDHYKQELIKYYFILWKYHWTIETNVFILNYQKVGNGDHSITHQCSTNWKKLIFKTSLVWLEQMKLIWKWYY